MKNLNIKTCKPNLSSSSYQFFLLSKGYNAGKPLEKPCPNCFVIETQSLQERAKVFWVCYALWKSGAYLPLLHGSVIPFLRIGDVSSEIQRALTFVNGDVARFENFVAEFQKLSRTERLIEKQAKLIGEIKSLMCRKMFK